MGDNRLLVLGVILVIFVVMCMYSKRRDNFAPTEKGCDRDRKCEKGEFCYMGRCWGYWKNDPMPWSNCRNPYCTSVDKNVSCMASDTCLPYCKCMMRRNPGGSLQSACFPKCGAVCSSNDDCPAGCPSCRYGRCSAPEDESQREILNTIW